MEQGEISCISGGRRDAEETPRVGAVTGQQAAPPLVRGKPSVLQRQTVTSPWQCSIEGSSGNAGPPDLLTSDFPSRSSPAPKDRRRGTDTLCFPPTCSRACVCVCVCVCKDPLYSTGWAQALSCTPLPELRSQLWCLYWTRGVTSLPTPSSVSPSSGLSQDKAPSASPLCSQDKSWGNTAHSKAGHCLTTLVAVSPPRTPQASCLLARGGTTEVPWEKQGTVW